MKHLTGILLSAACAAALSAASVTTSMAGGSHGGGGHSVVQHNNYTHDGNQNGAANKPTSFAQPKLPVVRDHGTKQPTPGRTVCRGHGSCYTDHRTGNHRIWTPNTQGPAGGPNNRKPPS